MIFCSMSGALITLRVDPVSLYQIANTNMQNYAVDLQGSLNRIVGIWEKLGVSWSGSSASAAQDFDTSGRTGHRQ